MIIQASSKNVAEAYGKLDLFGTLDQGKMADFVVLEADPLSDIENMRSIKMVVKEGSIVNRSQLPINPILTSTEASSPGAFRSKWHLKLSMEFTQS